MRGRRRRRGDGELVVEGVVAAMVIDRGWVGSDLEGQGFFLPSNSFLDIYFDNK